MNKLVLIVFLVFTNFTASAGEYTCNDALGPQKIIQEIHFPETWFPVKEEFLEQVKQYIKVINETGASIDESKVAILKDEEVGLVVTIYDSGLRMGKVLKKDGTPSYRQERFEGIERDEEGKFRLNIKSPKSKVFSLGNGFQTNWYSSFEDDGNPKYVFEYVKTYSIGDKTIHLNVRTDTPIKDTLKDLSVYLRVSKNNETAFFDTTQDIYFHCRLYFDNGVLNNSDIEVGFDGCRDRIDFSLDNNGQISSVKTGANYYNANELNPVFNDAIFIQAMGREKKDKNLEVDSQEAQILFGYIFGKKLKPETRLSSGLVTKILQAVTKNRDIELNQMFD